MNLTNFQTYRKHLIHGCQKVPVTGNFAGLFPSFASKKRKNGVVTP